MNTIEFKRTRTEGGIHALEIAGSIDAHNFEELEYAFDSYFDQEIYSLIVDVSRLEYISSAGVGVFIGAAGRAQANEGNIVAVGPRENVQEIFDLLGIGHIFPVVDTLKKAHAHFAAVSAGG